MRYNEGVRQVKDVTGTIFDIKEMAVHDGPGVRTTVFLKGCPLRCRWCHDTEGLSSAPQLMVKESRCTHCGRCRVPCSHPECQPFGRCLHTCPDGLLSVAGRQISSADLETHRRYTGVDNGMIRQNLRRLQQSGHPHLIRTPLIPGITDTEKNLAAIRRLIGDSPWEKLPYNTLAGAKYPMLGMTYPLDNKEAPHG